MRKLPLIVYLVASLIFSSCGLFGNSDDEPDEFTVDLDSEILRNGSAITITASNPTSNDINLLISNTGDPHIEKRNNGEWERIEEEPPSFGISIITLEPDHERSQQLSYDYINRSIESVPGEYRVYYDYYIDNEQGNIQSQYSDVFTVE